jgi:hypothetical protein
MAEYIRNPDLPPEFTWAPRTQYCRLPTALKLQGEVLVSMIDKVGGGWFAILHREDGIDKPLITRHCSSFEAGRMGAERWVLRHEQELRAKVAAKVAWIQQNVALHPASRGLSDSAKAGHGRAP